MPVLHISEVVALVGRGHLAINNQRGRRPGILCLADASVGAKAALGGRRLQRNEEDQEEGS